MLTFAVGRGVVPGAGFATAGPLLRMGGAALLVLGLLLAGASFEARLRAGRGRLARTGPYSRMRHPLYVGLALVLVGHLLRLPSQAGALAVVVGLAQYVWLATVEEREARAAFGAAWGEYEARTRPVLPLPRRARE